MESINNEKEVVLIKYYNVLFFLIFIRDRDELKKNSLLNAIEAEAEMKMHDIYTWCYHHEVPFETKFIYRKDFPLKANIWNLYSYYRFKREIKRRDKEGKES